MSVTRWGEAVRQIAKRGEFSQATLACEAGLNAMRLSRYLSGEYKRDDDYHAYAPGAVSVRAINRSVAKLARVPEAFDYLNALALGERLLKPERGDFAIGAAIALLLSFDDYFIHGAESAVSAAFDRAGWDLRQRGVLYSALAAMRGRQILSKLEGHRPRDLAFDEVLWLFESSGIPLERWVRHDVETTIRRVRERFSVLVDAEIARTSSERSERADILRKVGAHFDYALRDIMAAVHAGEFVKELARVSASRTPKRTPRKRLRKGHSL